MRCSTRSSSTLSSTFSSSTTSIFLPRCGEHGVERLGLRNRARKAVEHGALGAVRLVVALGDDADDDLVGHQIALGEQSPRPSCRASCPALTAARSMSPVESCGRPRCLRQDLCLRALAGARRSEQNQIQRRAPRSFAFLMRPSYCCAIRWLWICATVSIVTLTTIRIDVPPR